MTAKPPHRRTESEKSDGAQRESRNGSSASSVSPIDRSGRLAPDAAVSGSGCGASAFGGRLVDARGRAGLARPARSALLDGGDACAAGIGGAGSLGVFATAGIAGGAAGGGIEGTAGAAGGGGGRVVADIGGGVSAEPRFQSRLPPAGAGPNAAATAANATRRLRSRGPLATASRASRMLRKRAAGSRSRQRRMSALHRDGMSSFSSSEGGGGCGGAGGAVLSRRAMAGRNGGSTPVSISWRTTPNA